MSAPMAAAHMAGMTPERVPAAALPRLRIASFKLQFVERRVRAVPAEDASGCAFAGPGVDLLGAEADAVFARARPLLAWLEAREPVRVRTLSLDVGRRRLLVTLDAEGIGGSGKRVVKIDPGVDPVSSDELVALAAGVLEHLGQAVAGKLAERGKH
jgi:hypothetical protein